MRRSFFFGLVLFASVAAVQAQIVSLQLKNAKVAEKYKKFLIPVDGRYIVAGEISPSGNLKVVNNTFTMGKKNDIFVADPGDPLNVSYKIEAGERVKSPTGTILSVPQEDLEKVQYYMRDQTLAGLADEYKVRLKLVEDARAERDKLEKTTKEWADAHRTVVTYLERLQTWLSQTLFDRAAKKLEKSVLRESKALNADAVKARGDKARASARAVDTNHELEQCSQELTGGKMKFGIVESQHFRITHSTAAASKQRALDLAKLGETILEGFRRDFIDPNLGDDMSDPIPEGLFMEFWFGPSDLKLYEGFLNSYYGRKIEGENREKELKLSGTNARGARGVDYLSYWKADNDGELEGMVAHNLGHTLADLAFSNGRGMPIDWIGEGCAYFVSFEYLGRNSVTCVAFTKREYGKAEGKEGEKTVGMSARSEFNQLALEKGVSIAEMSVKDTAAMEDADIAKAWSLFDFFAHKEGKTGFLWLRSGCDARRKKDGFLVRWREASADLFKLTGGGDPLEELERRWKEYAKSGQKKDPGVKKVK